MSLPADKKLIIFDLDGTLSPSKSPLEPAMGELLVRLLDIVKVAVISGGNFHQFETQFLRNLPHRTRGDSHAGSHPKFSHLFLLPTSGTRLYSWKGGWHLEYAEDLTPHEREHALNVISDALKLSRYEKPAATYGPIIEDRGSQITFSALGQNAPLAAKQAWDPSRAKREKIAEIIRRKLVGFDVRIGGSTSVDITKKGVNKAYGIRKLEHRLDLSPDHIIFVGDALYLGGNDHPARATGVDCIQVSGPAQTAKLIETWLS